MNGGFTVEKILQQILSEISALSKGQSELSKDVTQIIQRLDTIDDKLDNIQGITMNNSKFIQALSTDIMQCATKENIDTLSAKIDVLNDRTFIQETKLKLIEAK